MDENQALQQLDAELDAALGGLTASPAFAATVLKRVRKPARLPEILDALGLFALLAAAAVALAYLAPPIEVGVMAFTVATAIIVIAGFAFAIHTLRDV